MKVLLALNNPEMEHYISNIDGIEVCDILKEKKSIEGKVKEHLPDLLIILHSGIQGDENIKDVILRITSNEFPSFRIAYLYGKDNAERKAFINFLISRGIYDYYVGSDITSDVIDNLIFSPKTRDDVKQDILPEFYAEPIANTSNESKEVKEVINEVIIEKGKIIGTVVIAVAGTMHRIGTTHTAIQLATFLKELKHKVAVMELHNSDNFEAIKSSYEDVKDEGNMFTLGGIDYYPYSPNLKVLDLLELEYEYLILDMGVYNEQNSIIDEFKRANVRIIVSGAKDWELTALESILKTGDKISKNKYYFTFANNAMFKMILSNMGKLKCYQAPYNPDPFINAFECEAVFNDLLKEVLPGFKKSKKGLKFDVFDFINKLLPRSKGNEA